MIVADPLSGTSALLAAALEESTPPSVLVDARRCANSLDLAMAIADGAIAALAPDASAWWMGAAPPSSTAGLSVSRLLNGRRIDPQALRSGEGQDVSRLYEALELTAALAEGPITLAIDTSDTCSRTSAAPPPEKSSALSEQHASKPVASTLCSLTIPTGRSAWRSATNNTPYTAPASAYASAAPPRPRVVEDLVITKPLVKTPVPLLRAAAELAAGVPDLTWQAIAMAPNEGENPARALSGWEALRHATAVSVRREWDLLRRVHPAAQTIVGAISIGLKPHNAPAASKTIDDALNRLRDVGMAWQPAERTWAIADPLLSAYAREHPQPWALR